MFDEEDYADDEYIQKDNDPTGVEQITQEDYTIPEEEEEIGLDEVLEIIRCKIANMSDYDHMRQEKVLDSLRKGEFRK